MTRHARERAGRRYISTQALVRALVHGEILEEYTNDLRGPSALCWGIPTMVARYMPSAPLIPVVYL